MIIDIGDIIISKISLLPFLDKFAGVVKILSYMQPDKDNKSVKKTFPAYCKNPINETACDTSRYLDLCPDNKKKSVLYLEDKGVALRSVDGHKLTFLASYDLVCWLNLPLLGVPNCSFSAIAMTSIIKELIGKGVPFQSGIYQRISIRPQGEQSKNINPFAKYSYNLENAQLLMFPFDYFVMPLQVEFVIDSRCINDIVLNPLIPCLNS